MTTDLHKNTPISLRTLLSHRLHNALTVNAGEIVMSLARMSGCRNLDGFIVVVRLKTACLS